MPVLDSFLVDHTIMPAPAVRIAKTMQTPKGDAITVFDIRFCKPNQEIISGRGIHTLEHLFAGFIREYLNAEDVEIIDVSPMGCRTGFYMSLIGAPAEERVVAAWKKSMEDVLKVESEADIPELNEYQCGTYTMHSLADAKATAQKVLDREISITKNEDILLSAEKLRELGNKI